MFAQPLVFAAAIGVALETALHAAHLSGVWREVVLVAGLALLASTGALLIKRALRYAGLRVVSTNRRIFAIRGVIVQRITPLGNTALAASTISQGVLGRMFGYGSIDLPLADGTPDTFRDMRDALELYTRISSRRERCRRRRVENPPCGRRSSLKEDMLCGSSRVLRR